MECDAAAPRAPSQQRRRVAAEAEDEEALRLALA
jgi:hypothetical protein